MTTRGFEPNFKFEKCEACDERKGYLNKFQLCNLCSSRNDVIDNFIRYTKGRMKFISYDKFKDVTFIAEGGFSKIYKATWINYRSEMMVALKELNNSKNINSKELNEVLCSILY